MAVRVFVVNDYDYYAGDCSPEEILAHYMEMTGCTHEESTGDESDFPIELSEEELVWRILVDEESFQPMQTFREYLDELISNGVKFPCYFVGVDV